MLLGRIESFIGSLPRPGKAEEVSTDICRMTALARLRLRP
jgi:hypothetical protein